MAKRALVTGITGQDGSYLAELLLGKGYEVHGVVRRVALEDASHRLFRLRDVVDRLVLHGASLESFPSFFDVIHEVRPDECYHLAAQSFVSYALEDETATLAANITGTHHVLAAIKRAAPECRLYYAGSSEMFGSAPETPQRETTSMLPRSAHGISKLAGYHLARSYRDAHGLRAACGILFNHESPRRGWEFVSRKITSAVARIKAGQQRTLALGNLDARRDWGFAGDYVDAMWRMVQRDPPGDYVVATGVTHTVREFVERAFACVDLPWEPHVVQDPRFFRPAELHVLQGDASKARRELGWTPTMSFDQLVETMVRADVDALSRR